MRCSGHIVERGMTREQVLEYCGQPDQTDNMSELAWTYRNPGHQMKHVVYFYNNGNVERVESVSQQ